MAMAMGGMWLRSLHKPKALGEGIREEEESSRQARTSLINKNDPNPSRGNQQTHHRHTTHGPMGQIRLP